MPELNLSPELLQALQTAGLAIISYFAVLWLAMVVWAFADVSQRTRNWLGRLLAALVVLVLWLPGLILYLLLRPHRTLNEAYESALEEEALLQDLEERLVCPTCQRRVKEDYILCPHCETRLKETCRSCSRPLALEWSVCPYCGARTPRREAALAAEVVEAAPAAPDAPGAPGPPGMAPYR